MRDKLITQLIQHEGLRLKPYSDTVGKVTIGVGRNLTDVGISESEAMTLLDHDVDLVLADLLTFPWFISLDPIRQRVVADMRFNLGPTRFRGFQRMIGALAAGDYQRAADSMAESLWARQVKQRATRLIIMMRTGGEP